MKNLNFFVILLLAVDAWAGGAPGHGNQFILATYWGDDAIALIDINGAPGKEEVWRIDTLKAAGCPKPYDIRSSPKGDEAYVSCSGADLVAVVDIPAQQVKYTIKTGSSPRDLVVFDEGRKLIVANSGNDTVSVIDLVSKKKSYDFPISNQPYGVAVAPNGVDATITGWASGDLHFVKLGKDSAKYIGKVDVGLLPYTVVTPGDGSIAYVATNASHAVVAVDTKSEKILQTIKVGRNPWSLAASPDGNSLLVTNNRSNNLSLLKTGMAISAAGANQITISAGAQLHEDGEETKRAPKNASISANSKIGAFTDLANNQIVVVDLPDNKITKVINTGKAPYGIEFIR
ncbi:TPA: YncE family protein [Pseudomonas aeruginosa]|uniref:YncE family protein n=1 Tax=Pseudomonas aeruginosa TaxID=287 RepID=UPI001377A67F|nr:YncE family protein [Pseudomonas aeruginosa]EMB4310495.1 YncE family protein [Pseudomonas aeruginosa]MDT1113996.1 YncE family protein [Pseudomonas aeruginosa]QWY09093.1 YncE family protein [Pseudomonas aeruginosa]WAJ92983.1 YncE family protein [Pseudomonas aeruginosa]WAJ98788.1 YncE family protein [Pseudomonas aeruginosa]